MNARKLLFAALAACTVIGALPSLAQERGTWSAASSSARGTTGDVAFTAVKLILNFSAFPIAQIRALQPAEAQAVFNTDPDPNARGNLYRLSVPASKQFLHHNTLCGSEETQWAVTAVSGHTLHLALFSGATMPTLTAEAMVNTTDLCGTFTYTR